MYAEIYYCYTLLFVMQYFITLFIFEQFELVT